MEELQPAFDRNVQCLYCNHKFTTKKIRSRFIKVTNYDSDFRPNYANNQANALYYNISVCPSCGFSFSDDFTKYFAPGTRQLIQERVASKWIATDYSGERTADDAINAYKLAGYCATLKKEKHISIAGIFLRIAWLYREKGEHEQEQRFLKLARHEYMESYSTDDFKGTQVSEVRLLYLAGELSTRIGDIPAAMKYFSLVIEKQKQTVETKLIDMAKERWQEIRDTKKLSEATN
ncbi:DUF2225 domain-containing protein [Bacillus sp. V5-8f]|uniref:DUF2225 domain-containing protein n=1 Tax=Bacillus sp. V5-8f TaxID=2053044 RepID=UPI000C7651CD|nr:DUF2225 domain-containing protein [Bacillus sp. V5-8f]PLT34006.1 DUF2225 domain-containing protein [Bacillus sp. V5-8f]